jgi:hypothetical protein
MSFPWKTSLSQLRNHEKMEVPASVDQFNVPIAGTLIWPNNVTDISCVQEAPMDTDSEVSEADDIFILTFGTNGSLLSLRPPHSNHRSTEIILSTNG